MPSPFPGMDPYLEHPAHWMDFHATFINYWREALAATLPEHYTARIGTRVYLTEGPPVVRKLTYPDVAVERHPGPPASTPPTVTATAAVRTPVTLPLLVFDQPLETYIEILHRPDRSLVAVLEVLSPANKVDPGREVYLAKRQALLLQKVHLIELDLLLGGARLPLRAPLPPADYYAFIAHAERRWDCDVYSWQLPEPLPVLPIPLRAPDADVLTDLAAVFATVYERGGYRREIDYAQPPPVAMSEERLKWVAACLQAAQP
jgi:hypothetical protein